MISCLKGDTNTVESPATLSGVAWVLIHSSHPGTYFQSFAEPLGAEGYFLFLWACVHIHSSLYNCIEILLHGQRHFLNQVRRLMSLLVEYGYCAF